MGSRAETRTWVGQRKAETPVWTDTEMPSSRFTWTRPTTHIYSYNREAQNIISSRSARATSVAANESRSAMNSTSESTMRSSRAASVAATSDNFSGYSGYYGRQLAQIMQKQGPTAAAAAVPIRESLRAGSPAPTIYPNKAVASGSASASSSTSVARSTAVSTKETTTTESKISREQVLRAQSESNTGRDRNPKPSVALRCMLLAVERTQGTQFCQGASQTTSARLLPTCTSPPMSPRRSTPPRPPTLRAASRWTAWRSSCSTCPTPPCPTSRSTPSLPPR